MVNGITEFEVIYKVLTDTICIIKTDPVVRSFVIKGGTVLITNMLMNNRLDLLRQTTDIDIHCSNREVWIYFKKNIEKILNNNGLGYKYTYIRSRLDKKGSPFIDSDSLILRVEFNNTWFEFNIDMNVKPDESIEVCYLDSLNSLTYSPLTMISDKIVVVSSQKVYRRIKDLYDLYCLLSMFTFNHVDILRMLRVKHKDVDLKNMLVPKNYDALEHAWGLFKGVSNKPSIDTLLSVAYRFLEPIYNEKRGREVSTWIPDELRWM